MSDFFLNFKTSLRWIDLFDVAIVAFMIYRVLLLIKGTRAMQMLTGLGILAIGFFVSSTLELFTTHWLLSHFFDYLVLMVIVLFQDDIRRALTHVGKNPFFSSQTTAQEMALIDEVAKAATLLARKKMGALFVIERETGLKNVMETGTLLDAEVKSELMHSIFLPTSPIHDGAVILSGGRIAAAGCFLPLSQDPNIDSRLGTRHRAALGVTEETDAVVVLVSEEAGEAHLVKNGRMISNLSETEIAQSLKALFDLGSVSKDLPSRIRHFVRILKDLKKGRVFRGKK